MASFQLLKSDQLIIYRIVLTNYQIKTNLITNFSISIYNYHFNFIQISKVFFMSTINSNQSQFSKFISYEKVDGTQSTENFSKFCQNCKLIKDQLEGQIFSLKDKAHQSFMQVIQVQQLHEEQLQLMKQQHQDQITVLREQISKLQTHVTKTRQDLISMEKNSKHHICQVQSPSFFLDSIDIINCQDEDGKQSNLDQSSYVQFNEFISIKNIPKEQQFLKTQTETLKQGIKTKQYEEKITKLNMRILELEAEVQSLWQTNQELKKQVVKHQGNAKIMKNNYDSLYKESKFMSDHIRQLSNDKFKFERRIKQLEKEIKQLKHTDDIKSLKRSATFQQQSNNYKIRLSGSGFFGTQQYDNVRNSLQSSKDQKDSGENKTFVTQSINFEDLVKARSSANIMTKSNVMNKNEQIKAPQEIRKSMPNYKKISHVPSFKKVNSANKSPIVQKDFLMVKQQDQQKQSSNFIDDIYKQLQQQANVANLKKSYGPASQQGIKKQMFRDSYKKAGWYQKTC